MKSFGTTKLNLNRFFNRARATAIHGFIKMRADLVCEARRRCIVCVCVVRACCVRADMFPLNEMRHPIL